jgi:hypothetical protein
MDLLNFSGENKQRLLTEESNVAIQERRKTSSEEFGFGPALLRTESSREFEALVEGIVRYVKPQDIIQEMYVDDFAKVTWKIFRYRRAQAAMIDNGLEAGLANVLRSLLLGSQHIDKADRFAHDLAHHWAIHPETRRRVSALLKEAGLGEPSIEAEALRLRLNEIEQLDRMIAMQEARRDKLLRDISRYSKRFAKNLKESSDRLSKMDEVPSIAPSEREE